MKITDKTQINLEKLKDRINERGHGIINEQFWYGFDVSLNDSSMEVHQCPCGELIFTDTNNKLPKDSQNNILCKICGNYKDLTVSYKEIQLIDDLVEKTRLYNETQIADERKKIINDIQKIAKPWFPINSFHELHYALNIHQFYTSNYANEFYFILKEIKDLCSKAKLSNKTYYLYIFSKIDIVMMNTKLRSFYVEREDFERKFKEKSISNLNLNELTSVYPDKAFKEDILRKMVALYRLRIENIEPLKFLANLSLVIQNFPPKDKPYPNEALAKIVDYVINLPEIKGIKNYIEKCYRTQLRNDDAHVQFMVLEGENKIYSRKYNVSYSIDELSGLYKKLDSFHEAFQHIIDLNAQIEPWMGIRSIKFEFDENKFESSIKIFQFLYFNIEKNIPKIKVKLIEDKSTFQIHFGEIVLNQIIDKESVLWYTKLILTQKFKIKLNLISPKLGYYYRIAKFIVKIENNNFYLIGIRNQDIRIPKEYTEKIREFIIKKGYL